MTMTLGLDDVSAGHPAALRQLDELREDATCYRWLVANWGRVFTCLSGVDEPRVVMAIELGSGTLSSVDPESLHRAILRAMAT